MADILAGKCQATITRRDPGLPAKDAEARGHALVARIMDTLVARGILADEGFNPSGLKKGVTTKMTQYGEVALGRAAAPVAVMDPVQDRILSAEHAIAEQFPDGDVGALGERLLSDMVALFQEMERRGELDQHADLLARCNEHASLLGGALEKNDRATIVAALAPTIEDFRLVTSIS